MADFRTSLDQDIEAANKSITCLGTTLQLENDALSKICSELKDDNAEMSACVVSKIEKLQKDHATENAIMEKLAQKIEKIQGSFYQTQLCN